MSDRPTRLVFFDIEASSLEPGGWPLEIGWVEETGQGEGYLIRPAPSWTVWSEASERIHGISRERLLAEGRDVGWVARRVAAAFAGRTPVASAVRWDGQWLRMLLEAGGVDARFEILPNERAEMMACAPMLALLRGEDNSPERWRTEREVRDRMQEIIGNAADAEEMRGPTAHRAVADAMGLWRVWRSIGERAEAEVRKAREAGAG